jgi:hypothetical protein
MGLDKAGKQGVASQIDDSCIASAQHAYAFVITDSQDAVILDGQ